MFDDKKILITGGTGSFGRAFLKRILNEPIKKIYIFSRDELKQWEMKKEFETDNRVCFLLGDIRDKDRLYRAFEGIDYVVHAAAQKHVPSCEFNPFEAVKTNIIGTENIINAAIDREVKKVIALSTDKAVKPINLYGCTKSVMEKLFIHGNNYSGNKSTSFACVRYGNVIGSRGSVLESWKKAKEQNDNIYLTDIRMTRFWISLDYAVNFVINSLDGMKKEEIYVPELKSMRLIDMAKIFADEENIILTGSRQGEKLDEILISKEEARNTLKVVCMNSFFIICSNKEIRLEKEKSYFDTLMLGSNFEYSSGENSDWITSDEMRKLIWKKW